MAKRGLGSKNMSQADKNRIHRMGGRASHGGGRKSETFAQRLTRSRKIRGRMRRTLKSIF